MQNKVQTSTGSYQIITGYGLLDKLSQVLPDDIAGRKIMVVTDDNVAPLYLPKVLASYPSAKTYVIPHGEMSKSFALAEEIASNLAANNFTRNDYVFALGGGVVGDLAGFVSSIYMRGIPYIQLPTSLLAGIDSSVGGKTAVNIAFGKNLVGRIYPPKFVVYDLNTLATLPEEFIRDGLGEGLKYALLSGSETFDILMDGLNKNNTERFVDLCIEYKKKVVEEDENEKSIRRLLNLGHTLGHAIERESGLKITHGVAVAMGLKMICRSCYDNGLLQKSDYEKISALLNKYNVADNPYPIDKLLSHVTVDKKTDCDFINLVTVHGIGDCRIEKMPLDKLGEFFR